MIKHGEVKVDASFEDALVDNLLAKYTQLIGWKAKVVATQYWKNCLNCDKFPRSNQSNLQNENCGL
jgi:hypothetical protein